MRIVAWIARVVLGGVFLWASVTKVPDVGAFAESVANYRIVPATLVPVTAAAVLGVEIVVGVALVLGLWSRAAALIAAGLLAVFTVGLASALGRGIDLACGCFGGSDQATWWTVLRDIGLLAFALAVAAASPAGPPASAPPVDPASIP